MTTVSADSRGRLYIPKNIRETHGDTFRIVKLRDSIKLIPLNQDPVEGLRKSMKGLEELSTDEIKNVIEEEAEKEILNE